MKPINIINAVSLQLRSIFKLRKGFRQHETALVQWNTGPRLLRAFFSYKTVCLTGGTSEYRSRLEAAQGFYNVRVLTSDAFGSRFTKIFCYASSRRS